MIEEFIACATKAGSNTSTTPPTLAQIQDDCARVMKANGYTQMFIYKLVGIVKTEAPPVKFEATVAPKAV